ncbi:unnamed protein product [Didymodactylos carnosus]|uniref:Golgi apparatus protein 1 n=1 Tax=Didymodactylos carnosus TaxID=1234261 RepID=A0A815BMK4_9BILA|nr:unnamed protein product [Didymodactylos carnosus]CAF1272401.1 unnamed protein product [Didymodactylos carnosus]CAF3531946.1 unnamed protein product [Didymodactylos carnosus]CAF4061614.1 unnamed protein product [Didymodactylos carnosus]
MFTLAFLPLSAERIVKEQKEETEEQKEPPPPDQKTRSQEQSIAQSRSPVASLALSPQCKEDITKYCNKGNQRAISNLKVLQCIDNLDDAVHLIKVECQHLIYEFKFNMTKDERFDDAARQQCKKDIDQLKECEMHEDERGTGRLISCLFDRLSNITEDKCRYFINQMQSVIFNDWTLSEYFLTECKPDITKLQCGRLDDDNKKRLNHDQGAVVSCLSTKFSSLVPECKKQIFRLAEMQSDDYHTDRALYHACRDDRERLCPQVSAGNGRVRIIMLTIVYGEQIVDSCRREMLTHRRMLMSDYTLSSDIKTNCNTEMTNYCGPWLIAGAVGTAEQRSGQMLHCLLKEARIRKNKFDKKCLASLRTLIRAADPGEDVRADPVLERDCQSVINTACSRMKPGESNVIMCLLDNLKSSQMTELCEDRLMEISYFIARDWRLTPKLLRSCKSPLETYCSLEKDWSLDKDMSDTKVGYLLGCLYQQREQLTSECGSELQRLMRIRSKSINLLPEIEDACIQDLGKFCEESDHKGDELKCLQEKYEELDSTCQTAVKNYTADTMTYASLDFLLMKACEPMIQRFCSNVENGNENDMIRCLVQNKNDGTMDSRCKAGIEHHQIVRMFFCIKDVFLSRQFQAQCSSEITDHCPKKRSKAIIIECLADLMLKDVLQPQKTLKIGENCRNELKFELFQRAENINLDPLMRRACKKDIEQLCKEEKAGNAQIIDCLKENRDKIRSKNCYTKLYKREKLDILSPENDYSLKTRCSDFIANFCSNQRKQNILSCLRKNINQATMPPTCHRVVMHRLMILNSDARFNGALQKNCYQDIQTHCKDKIITDDDSDEQEEEEQKLTENKDNDDGDVIDRQMGGRVIECLRSKYADSKDSVLQPQCVTELIDVIQASKTDVKFDVQLYSNCKSILAKQCLGVDDDKEDCLKLLFQKGAIDDGKCKTQIIRIIREGEADIHVDRALASTCQVDIMKYCNDIPLGKGKQLQCLLTYADKSLTKECSKMLKKRKELWDLSGVSSHTFS